MKYTVNEKQGIIKKFTIAFIILNIFFSILTIMTSEDYSQIQGSLIFVGIIILGNIANLFLLKNYEKNKTPIVIIGLLNLFSNIIVFFAQIYVMYIELSADKGADKKYIPKIEMEFPKKPYGFLIGFILIFVLFYTSFLKKLGLNFSYENYLLVFLLYFLETMCLVIPFRKDLLSNFKVFKENLGVYIKYILKSFAIMLFVQVILNFVLLLITGQNATNENAIDELPLILRAILAMFIAPFIEEILFRGFIRKIIKNEKLFILVSGLIFGVLHVMYVEENILMYLYILTYASMGIFLARTYAKSNNIWTNICVHFLNNSLIMLAEIISTNIQG